MNCLSFISDILQERVIVQAVVVDVAISESRPTFLMDFEYFRIWASIWSISGLVEIRQARHSWKSEVLLIDGRIHVHVCRYFTKRNQAGRRHVTAGYHHIWHALLRQLMRHLHHFIILDGQQLRECVFIICFWLHEEFIHRVWRFVFFLKLLDVERCSITHIFMYKLAGHHSAVHHLAWLAT